ncbi:MAG: cyclodeaminase/cyclohydrolase family protein [Oscillospiraceae bacterium]
MAPRRRQAVSGSGRALAAALAEMVAHLTAGREKYAAVQEEMQHLLEELPALRGKLLEAVDRDSRAFDRYMEALAMPKATPEEQTARKAAMQEGLKAVAQVPMEVAETVASLFPALETAVRKGNPNAVTDGMVGTMLARTAVLGALFNVRVNLDSIHDPDFTAAMAARADAAQELALSWERRILSPIALAGTL